MNSPDTASQTSLAYDVGQAVSASFVAAFGDTSVSGTIQIQASNDIPNARYLDTFVPTNWANIPNASSTVTAGVANAILIPNMCFSYVRVIFTHSSGGSSTILVNMNLLSQ